jgi:transposase
MSGHGDLFGDDPSCEARAVQARRRGEARVVRPNRAQVELRPTDLESLLPEGHRARLVWDWVERQDLSGFYAAIKVEQGGSGRSAFAPELLLGLWLYATLEGVGSARELSRLVVSHDAYRWLAGGVQVNHHALSDFRVEHGAALDELLSTSVAALVCSGAVSVQRVAQDGVRVRASAGAASFRRRATLEEHLAAAREHVAGLKRDVQASADPSVSSRRAQAARERAARERRERLERAVSRLPELEAAKRRNGDDPAKARASTTDAEASVMKMADGGYRPAYNTQFASDVATQVVLGVEVTTAGTDGHALEPMLAQLESRYDARPDEWLVDGGYATHEALTSIGEQVTVYAPVPEPRRATAQSADRYAPKRGDSEAVMRWRARMATAAGQAVYRQRAQAECIHALARNRGLTQYPVRGRAKVRAVALLHALAHNLLRTSALVPEWFTRAARPAAWGEVLI